jgi:NADPH:quinone reductase
MKIVRFETPGGPEVLHYVEAPKPAPAPGEVLVKAHAIGVGIPDTVIRKGTYGWMPPLPATPGTEMAGVVEAVGSGVTERKPGQRVLVSARERPQRGGCYAEYIATPADGTFVLPDSVSFEAAASLANYQVAWHMIEDAMRPRAADKILLYAAAGGMGNAVIDLARARDMTVIGVASGAARCAFAREMGAHHVIDRATEDVAARVAEITGDGVDWIIDPVGAPLIAANLAMLAPLGTLVIYGGLGGTAPVDLMAELRKHGGRCVAVRRFSIHLWDHLVEERRIGMRRLIELLAEGTIRPRIHGVLPLSEAPRAHQMLEAGEVQGKLLLVP